MKYSKVIKNYLENKSSNFIYYTFSFLLLFTVCYFYIDNNIKGTNAAFGDVTGSLTIPYTITYNSNFPDDSTDSVVIKKSSSKQHTVLDNMFDVPVGYEFTGWNTTVDGSGTSYQFNILLSLDKDMELYAQWILVSDNENNDIEDGNTPEVDNDGDVIVDDEDNSSSSDLPTEDDENVTDDDSSTDEDSNTDISGDDESSAGSGTGSGSVSGSGSGSSSSGSSSSGSSSSGSSSSGSSSGGASSKPSGNGANSGSSSSNSKPSVPSNNEENDDEDNNEENKGPIIYEFKFINGVLEYDRTTCEADENGNCELILPSNEPSKYGYIFTGWSLDKECSDNKLINNSINVSEGNTYYACYIENSSSDNDVNIFTVILVISSVWVLAGGSIYYAIRHFRKNEDND